MTKRSYQFPVHAFLAFLALLLSAMCPTNAKAQGWAVDVDPTIVGIQSSYSVAAGSGAFLVDIYLFMWDTTGIGPTPWNAYAIDIEINDSPSCTPPFPIGLGGPTVFDPASSGLASATTTDIGASALIAAATSLTSMGLAGGATGPGGVFCTSDGGATVLEGAGSFFPPDGVFGPPGTPLLVENLSIVPLAVGVSDVAPIGLFDTTTPIFPPAVSFIWPAVAELALVPTVGPLILLPAGGIPTPPPCAGICPGTVTVTTALPVELTRFDAVTDNGAVRLSWETASEQNNAGFEIQRLERTIDPGLAVEDWVAIGYIEGAGTTNDARSYEYLVTDVLIGRNVFRLKQIDFDGAFEYTDHVEVTAEIPGTFVLEPAYPNPFNPTTTVQFAVATDQHVEAVLYDALGKPVQSVYSGDVSANELATIRVNGSNLSSGVYVLRLEGENFVGAEKLLLIK